MTTFSEIAVRLYVVPNHSVQVRWLSSSSTIFSTLLSLYSWDCRVSLSLLLAPFKHQLLSKQTVHCKGTSASEAERSVQQWQEKNQVADAA